VGATFFRWPRSYCHELRDSCYVWCSTDPACWVAWMGAPVYPQGENFPEHG
jgi:hypothetical protein